MSLQLVSNTVAVRAAPSVNLELETMRTGLLSDLSSFRTSSVVLMFMFYLFIFSHVCTAML